MGSTDKRRPVPETNVLRVGTWNVEYAAGAEKNAERQKKLADVNADIWVLTETHDCLVPSDEHRKVASSCQRPTAREGGKWVTIWSRFPVLEELRVLDRKRTAAAVLDTPAGRVIVYGTVLPWHSDRGDHPPDAVVRNWSEHHRVIPKQAGEWKAIQTAHPGASLIVAGDLNMNLGGSHYYGTKLGRKLLRDEMADLGLACATEIDPQGRLKYPPIDHVLSPTSWKSRVTDAWEGRRENLPRLSDHSGLVVELQG